MMYVLISLSFVIHLFSILAIIVLFQRRSLERVNLPTMQEDVETIHESIEAFVDEVEKENERLYEQMEVSIKQHSDEWKDRLEELKIRVHQLEDSLARLDKGSPFLYREVQANDESAVPPEPSNHPNISSNTDQGDEHPIVEHPVQARGSADEKVDGQQSKQETYQRVVDLYKQGFSIDDIAKLLKIGKGEAMLLVNLLEKKQ